MWDENLQQRRRDGHSIINGWLSIPCGFTAEVMAKQGWDSLTIDMQHGLIDYQSAVAMLTAISTTSVTPLVRVPWLEEGIIMKMLDAGAHGIICPMVNNRSDAMRLVAAARYPPIGERSYGPIRAQLVGGEDYHQRANDSILVLAMIETKQAVENADEILSVPGLDGVYVGPADLACSLGCTPSFTPDAPPVTEAIARILTAAKKHNVFAGIHTGSAEYAQKMLALGFNLVTVMSDARLMVAAAKKVLLQTRGDSVAAVKKQENY